MILSNIDNTIKYEETKAIATNDIEHEASIYSAKIYNKTIEFVLGLPQFEHKSKNVVYFNIYLANKGFVLSKIGIYETYNSDYASLLDDDGDVDLSKMPEPILFSFTKTLISNLDTSVVEKSEEYDEDADEDEDEDEYEDEY
jgi:hypothetical protein